MFGLQPLRHMSTLPRADSLRRYQAFDLEHLPDTDFTCILGGFLAAGIPPVLDAPPSASKPRPARRPQPCSTVNSKRRSPPGQLLLRQPPTCAGFLRRKNAPLDRHNDLGFDPYSPAEGVDGW
jgi:hypothetical protein